MTIIPIFTATRAARSMTLKAPILRPRRQGWVLVLVLEVGVGAGELREWERQCQVGCRSGGEGAGAGDSDSGCGERQVLGLLVP